MNFEETLQKLVDLAAIYGIKIVLALVIFIVGRWIAKSLSRLTEKTMVKRHVDLALQHFISSIVYYGLLVFVLIAALSQVGIQTASLIAVVGAAGLAIGLALQGSLANFAAGFLILMFRPFKIGDYIEAAGTSGTVEKIMIFTTELLTPDNKKVIIPNGAVTSSNIVNYSAKDTRRVDLVIGISYGDDIDKAKSVLREVVLADQRVLPEPAVNIAVSQLADSSVNIIVRPWVATGDYWGVYWDLTEAIKKRLDQEGISIPFPQRDVHLHQAT
ncbi:MAG: mechanosensitive ion channel protein [Gammaproteobacteria bacterium BRH_c0]|nr:MAG: mechanosensitive ion channel protein [Gammaproteobacteria bacterium BRH_c0]